jgi:hypothetical protein
MCQLFTGPRDERRLIAQLTVTPGRVVQGGDVTAEMVLWNNTDREMLIEGTCCWIFQVYDSGMQELHISWVCPAEVCRTKQLMPGEKMRIAQKFPTLTPSQYADYWPSDHGKLVAGEYTVTSTWGHVKDDTKNATSGEAAFYVIKPRRTF